jgi:uncharacterized protein YjiS (DUF1127 family)
MNSAHSNSEDSSFVMQAPTGLKLFRKREGAPMEAEDGTSFVESAGDLGPRADRLSGLGLAALTSLLALPRLSREWRRRTAARRHLCALEDHVLADFGLTRQEVVAEAAKPFWRPLDPGSLR